jgi:hypothetical protein
LTQFRKLRLSRVVFKRLRLDAGGGNFFLLGGVSELAIYANRQAGEAPLSRRNVFAIKDASAALSKPPRRMNLPLTIR